MQGRRPIFLNLPALPRATILGTSWLSPGAPDEMGSQGNRGELRVIGFEDFALSDGFGFRVGGFVVRCVR